MVMNQPSQWQPVPRDGWPGSSSPQDNRGQRRGIVHWWVTLTGPGDDAPQQTLADRSRLRRARLASAVMFGMLIVAFGALPLGLQDPAHATLAADAVLFLSVLVAALLNRFGHVTSAGIILVATLLFAIAGSVLGAPALDLIYLPAFDLLAIVPGVAALVLPRRIMWFAALATIAFVVADMLLQTPSADLSKFVAQYGIYPLMARPVILILVITVLFQLVTGTLEAQIVRADRAEEVAELERREIERNRELEEGVRQLLAVHVHLANGDFSVKVPAIRNQLLWQIGSSLNNLIARLGRMAQADFVVRRTQEEANRLIEALYMVSSGRPPIWPNANGTPIAPLVDTLRNLMSRGSGGGGMPGAAGPAGAIAGGPQGFHLPPGAAGVSGPYADPGSRVPTSPNPPSSAFPGNPPSAVPSANNPAVPDWMRALMPPGAAPEVAPGQAPSPGPGWANAPGSAGMPGEPMQPPASESAYGGANPWSLDPEPLRDTELPQWLREQRPD